MSFKCDYFPEVEIKQGTSAVLRRNKTKIAEDGDRHLSWIKMLKILYPDKVLGQ